MSELKRCPFCGGDAQVNTWTMHGITESRCFCSNSDCPNSVRTVALEQWNTRPIEDALHARIAELEAAQRWIPVSERLPEIDDGDVKDYDVVLAYTHRRTVIVAKWGWDDFDKTQKRRWFDCDSDEWGPRDITEYVTHWRERPTPPEVQE